MQVKVVDDMMGSGKSSFAIQYMKESPNKRFIYVTPYLDEVQRVKEECGFFEPKHKYSKVISFNSLLEEGVSICTTHALFKMLDKESLQLIKDGEYVLILDEVLDVVSQDSIKMGDIHNLLELGVLKENNDGDYIAGNESILKKKSSEDNEYRHIAFNLLRNNLDIKKNKKTITFMWLFPIDLLHQFSEIFILTFMFDGYPLKGYLDLHNVIQKKYAVEVNNANLPYEERIYKLIDYRFPNMEEKKSLINLVQKGKMIDIGRRDYSFSLEWWKKLHYDDKQIIKKNTNNFLVNFVKSKSKDRILWTTFKGKSDSIKESVYTKYLNGENFLSHNIRATNKYRNKNIILYMCARYYNPYIKNYFKEKHININEEFYSLAEMIQWIFRSSIRDNKEIYLYIPSQYMRRLFISFLYGTL